MFKKVTVSIIILGFIHGYFMSHSRNKEKIDSVYTILESNKEYSLKRINEIIKNEGGVTEARKYLKEKERDLVLNNEEFVRENPRYTLIKDRGDYEE